MEPATAIGDSLQKAALWEFHKTLLRQWWKEYQNPPDYRPRLLLTDIQQLLDDAE